MEIFGKILEKLWLSSNKIKHKFSINLHFKCSSAALKTEGLTKGENYSVFPRKGVQFTRKIENLIFLRFASAKIQRSTDISALTFGDLRQYSGQDRKNLSGVFE